MSAENTIVISVQRKLSEADLRGVVEDVRHVSGCDLDIKQDEIVGRGFNLQNAQDAILIISAGGAVWFTKKWADTYLWPVIQRRLDKIQIIRDLRNL